MWVNAMWQAETVDDQNGTRPLWRNRELKVLKKIRKHYEQTRNVYTKDI